MNRAEYISRRQEICNARERALKELDERYAESNNPYKIGDYITDHIGTGKILDMAVARPFAKNTPPCMLYTVMCIGKNGKPSRTQPDRRVWQTNILEEGGNL
jgi:hypothetical protein